GLYFGTEVRPVMDLDHWELFQWTLREIRAAVPGRDPAPPRFASERSALPRLVAWYRLRYAEVAADTGYTEAADRAFGEASEILLRAGDPSARSAVMWAWAAKLDAHQETGRARKLLEESALENHHNGGSLSEAFSQVILAYRADREGDLAAAERSWLAALNIEEKLIPEGLEVGRVLGNLGYLALWRGDLAAAQERLNRSEAIQRRLSSSTYEYAGIVTNLALLAENLGDWERAERLHRQALALYAELAPESQAYAGSLMNLAMTLTMRGELAAAEDLLRQSVEMFDK